MTDTDQDLEDLRALPVRDADRAVSARVRASALAAFDHAHGGACARFGFFALRMWSRFGVPSMLAGLVCVYLRWALVMTFSLYH